MDIYHLQLLLTYLGYNPKSNMDGLNGPTTKAAVRDFQKVSNIGVDGIAGKETWAALKKAVVQDIFKPETTESGNAATSSAAGKFTPRLVRPEAGNPYYNTRSNGGYSDAIVGSPADSGCNVLANCVGYAYGRFNEIAGAGCCKYLRPTNAENFIANRGSLTYGQEPKVGGCMVWQKGATLSGSDGAGHVAIVEKINADGSVTTSESGWGGPVFTTKIRANGSGNWGAPNSYTYLGCIYQP